MSEKSAKYLEQHLASPSAILATVIVKVGGLG